MKVEVKNQVYSSPKPCYQSSVVGA